MHKMQKFTPLYLHLKLYNFKELFMYTYKLKVPWTARSNQSILREINTEYSLEGLMLKLKSQHFAYLM